MANAMRYSYLRGAAGRFRNPYDQGIKKNCTDFLINGYNEDVECIEEPGNSGGIMMNIARNSSLVNGDSHSHSAKGNGHVINVSSTSSNSSTRHAHAHGNGHVHSSHCSHNNSHGKTKNESIPLGLGLGLGLGRNTKSGASSS